jgi:hypothetical protein
MVEVRKSRVRWSSVGKLLIIAVLLCLTVPLSELSYQKYEEWRAVSKATDFLRKSQPGIELVVEGVHPTTQSRDAWNVSFGIVNHPEFDGVNVAITPRGRCTSYFRCLVSK